jgi:hypothetical protein
LWETSEVTRVWAFASKPAPTESMPGTRLCDTPVQEAGGSRESR